MKSTFYLVRHGEAEINKDPLQKTETDVLTELGLEQVSALVKRFQNTPVEKIYTSKISRAQLTAQEIGTAMHLTPTIVESLKERKVTHIDHQQYSHNESFEDFQTRLAETQRFLESLSHQSAIVVSHALYIRGLIAYIILGDLLTEESLRKIDETLIIENASVTKLIYNKEKNTWKIDYLNDRSHRAMQHI